MIQGMPHTSQHLLGLRQEITYLQNMNAICVARRGTSALDLLAIELRTNRLREIEEELSKLLNRP
jgi:hypothetical protein